MNAEILTTLLKHHSLDELEELIIDNKFPNVLNVILDHTVDVPHLLMSRLIKAGCLVSDASVSAIIAQDNIQLTEAWVMGKTKNMMLASMTASKMGLVKTFTAYPTAKVTKALIRNLNADNLAVFASIPGITTRVAGTCSRSKDLTVIMWLRLCGCEWGRLEFAPHSPEGRMLSALGYEF